MGLKENVIIGKLIPAGTGFRTGKETLEVVKDVSATPASMLIDDNTDEDILAAIAAARGHGQKP